MSVLNSWTEDMPESQKTAGRWQIAIWPKMNEIKKRLMKSISFWTTSAQGRASGLAGLMLLLALVSVLSWFLQPWQWPVWSEWALLFSVMRVIAYTVMAISFLYNAIDDLVRGRRTNIVWASLSFLFTFSIGTLSLDLGAVVAFIDSRTFLTFPALLAACTVAWQTSQRIADRLALDGNLPHERGEE